MAGAGEIRLLRRRIASVRNTQQITKAMEQIAASRVIKAQRAVNAARPYAEQLTEVIKGLAADNEVSGHPLLSPHETTTRAAVIAICSDRGLAGAYNSAALKRADKLIAAQESEGLDVDLFLVGRKGASFFNFRGRREERLWTGISDKPTIEDAQAIGKAVTDRYAEGHFDRVFIVYTDFKSLISQQPNVQTLLPVDKGEFEGGDELSPEIMFEPDPASILELLIPRYVEAKIFNALLESAASEHASRQRAMKSATDNADDVISKLSRTMNQARQDQVTTEISEIVGGAEALSNG